MFLVGQAPIYGGGPCRRQPLSQHERAIIALRNDDPKNHGGFGSIRKHSSIIDDRFTVDSRFAEIVNA
jgi:hypothetical protein